MADDKLASSVYAILDVETSGLSRKHDRIVQIACLKIDKDGSRKTWMRYVNPEMDSKYLKQAFLIHRIPSDFLKDKPLFKDVAESFCDFLKDVDYLVAHNCMFDWDMLCREFEIIDQNKKDESSEGDIFKLWWERFHREKNWVDTLRLAMVCFPRRETYRLGAIKEFLKIEPQQDLAGGDLSQYDDHGGDQWKMHQHDAMYDVFTTYEVLQHCMKSTFCDLLKDYPMALLDTTLLIDMQKLIDQKRTSTQDLLPFAKRSKEYFTTSRPRGKKLGDLSKNYLQMMTFYSKADERSDDRVILIYEAAILEPVENDMVSHSIVDGKKDEVEEKEKVENATMKKEEQEKSNKNEQLSHSSASLDKNLENEERIKDKMEEVNDKVEIDNEMEDEQEERNENELLSHSSASMKENTENHARGENKAGDKSKAEIAKEREEQQNEYAEREEGMEDKMEKNRSEAVIAKEMKDEQEKRETVENNERMEDNEMQEIKGEGEIINEMKGKPEKNETVEEVETVEDKMEGDKDEEEFVTEMKEEEKSEGAETEQRMEDEKEIKDEAEMVKEMKEEEKSENAETEQRMKDEMKEIKDEVEIVKEIKKEEKSENAETEQRMEDETKEIKDEVEMVKEIKEKEEKSDDDNDKENFNCSSPKRPKLSLQ